MKYLKLFEDIESKRDIDEFLPDFEDMVEELSDNGFKVYVKAGEYHLNIEVNIEKRYPFNINDIKDTLLFMESYSREELGLIITRVMIEDINKSFNYIDYDNIELLPNVKTEYIYINFIKQLE